MKSIYILAASSLLLCTAACSQVGPEGGNNPYKALELSTKGAEFVQKGSSFTFEYIDRINSESKGDYIISPLSMQFLLGMILDGAQGATADEICSVLGYGKGEVDAVNEYCLSMLEQLPKMDKKTKLNIANAIFVDEGWPLLGSYKSDVGKYYRAEVSNLDFSNGPASLKVINGWCSKHTEGLVPKILDEVSPDILAYLLNALYFKSQWSEKFSKALTAEELFTDESGTKSKVNMMKQEKSYNYTENEVFKAVTIPYGNGVYSMTVLLPVGAIAGALIGILAPQDGPVRGRFVAAKVRNQVPHQAQRYPVRHGHAPRFRRGPRRFQGNVRFRPVPEFRPAGRRHQSR